MRNDNMKWDAPLGDQRADIQGDGFQLSIVKPMRQTLISGPIKTCLSVCALGNATSWPDIATDDAYAIHLRRDRILAVNSAALPDGWHSQGVAISDMSGAYSVIEISGPKAIDLLNRGTELDTALPSGSVARQFHGFATLIYRWQSPDSYRLHLQRCYLETLWQRLQT